ncbi:putative aaa family protein [Diplogelasinospora grovesii]|uniref:Aaa family protein n=1 Tax=Diplogelasinospora grovesii TaxID=303347 RepID=A0AAN6NH60_9PEZI|nr:putative aaa family protein [Diplogelasinospora grovesii]
MRGSPGLKLSDPTADQATPSEKDRASRMVTTPLPDRHVESPVCTFPPYAAFPYQGFGVIFARPPWSFFYPTRPRSSLHCDDKTPAHTMRLRLPHISREDISETAWKWRYKVRSVLKRSDRTLSDYSSGSSFLDESKTGDGAGGAEGKERDRAGDDGKDASFGATPAVKTLYERRNSDDSWIDWVDYPPKQLSKSAAKSQDRVAIKVYKVRDTEKPSVNGRYALKNFRVDVQNTLLVAALAEILKKENEHLELGDTASFREPFRSLYFCYDDIVAKYRTLTENDQLKPYMLLLIKALDDIFSDIRAKRKSLMASGLINWNLAWTLFPKDCEIISWARNTELILKVVDTAIIWPQTAQAHLAIRCKVLRFNGEAFIWEDFDLEIPKFEGNKPITELPHYPLSLLPDAEEAKKRLVERGKKVLNYQGLTYCNYSGIGIYTEEKSMEKHNVDGRILIDVVGFNRHHLAQGIREGRDPESKKNIIPRTGRPNPVHDKKALEKAILARRLDEEEQQKNKEAMLAREQDLIFVSPLINGYALKNKLWLSFYVEDIKPMVWNDQAFDHLVYDQEQKDLVLSFVENHNNMKPILGDVIVGKGEGLIILLSGPPGTGKTLTAEAVADRTHRPLFYLQAEDLGVNAAVLGANIKRVFQMATEWNAVILLDEADVFMAERDPHDILRNELVSIFLRELEYFRGIIFLTTNLYKTIDSAFLSRVSLHLLFKPLTIEARESVWRKFLDRLPKPEERVVDSDAVDDMTRNQSSQSGITGDHVSEEAEEEEEEEEEEEDNKSSTAVAPGMDISDDDIKELAAWQLNGREIKNAVKMVKSWCDYKGYDLTLAKLENGIRVTSPHASKQPHANDMSLYDD